MKQATSVPNDYIWVADALPHQSPEIKKVKKSDFAKQHGFTWSEQFVFEETLSAAEQEAFHAELDAYIRATYNRSLAEVEDNIMLCPMGDAGYGAFTRKPITNGIVAVYVGRYITKNRVVVAKPGHKDYLLGTSDPNISIDSFEFRNTASYFQHAFTPESPDVIFTLEPEEHFAVANLRRTEIMVRGRPVSIIGSTLPSIPRHTLMTQDYSWDFFNSKGLSPLCFMTNGSPYKGKTPFEVCPANLKELRKLGLKIYQLIEALKTKTPTLLGVNVKNENEFIQCLSTLDFAILRSVSTGILDIRAEMHRADFSQKWKDFQSFAKMILPKIKDRTEFITRVQIFTLYYQMCELLSTCDISILDLLNNRYPKRFNYYDIFHQGLNNTQIILQSIILKNTGNDKIQKPTFEGFFDDKKAFWYHVKNKVSVLYKALSSEYPNFKKPAVIALNPARAPFLNNKPASQEDYNKMCAHLETVCGGEWKQSFANKRIYVQGDKITLGKIQEYLGLHKITTTVLKPLPKKENVFYFDIKDFKLEEINALASMPTKEAN